MQEFFIDSDGIKLHAKLELPEGAPERCPLCIVQHGLTGHMEENHIVAVAAALREVGVATLRVEMYGHGKSGGSFARHTLLKWIDNMLDVVDYAQGLDWVTDLYLCGHSQGGLLVMLVAALRPYAFKAIIPMSPAIVIVENALRGNLFGMPFDPVHIPDVITLGNPGDGSGFGISFCGDYFRIAQHIHVDEAIAAYHGPVLLVHGTADEGVPVQDSIDAAAAYEKGQIVLIDGDDHGYHAHLDQVCTAVQEFVRQLG